jgi:RNA polymerase sigma-70 factor, ECF subfamily
MTTHSVQLDKWTMANDDLELVHASNKGDVTAFEELVKRYDRKLFRIAQSVTHHREDSQDAVQEAFLKAFQHLAEFREASQFSTWLIRITLNQSLMKLRKRNAAKEFFLDDDLGEDGESLPRDIADWAPNPEQLYWATELREILASALEELSPVSRTVFVLRDVEGFSIEQTGMAMNLSSSAVKARLWRVRLQLRERLNKYFNKQAHSARAQAVPLNSRTGRILGMVAECLHYPFSGSSSGASAKSPQASPPQ